MVAPDETTKAINCVKALMAFLFIHFVYSLTYSFDLV